MSASFRYTVTAAVLLLGLTGCAPAPTSGSEGGQPRAASSHAPASSPLSTGASGVGAGPQAPANTGVPTPDTGQDAQAQAKALAVEIMTLFARPSVDAATWLAGLKPVATEAFMSENVHINPQYVGATTVSTAGDWTMDPANPYTVQVPVTTNGGVFIVQLHRAGASAPWMLRYVIPPTLRGNQ